MKFDEKFKQIIYEWQHLIDNPREYDDYMNEQREYLLREMKENPSTSNTSSYKIEFYKNSENTALIIVDSKRTSIMVPIELIKKANLNTNDKITLNEYNIYYDFSDSNYDEKYIDENDLFVNEITETEAHGDILINNNTQSSDELIDTELFEKIEEAIADFFIENHFGEDIIDDFENNTL